VDRVFLLVGNGAASIDGRAGHVEDTPENAFANGHGDGRAGVFDFHAALEPFGGGHRNGAREPTAEVLLDFERKRLGPTGGLELDAERLVNGRDFVFRKLDVDDGANDLGDFSGVAHDGF